MRKFFQRCAEIEEGVAAIYRQLANSSFGDYCRTNRVRLGEVE